MKQSCFVKNLQNHGFGIYAAAAPYYRATGSTFDAANYPNAVAGGVFFVALEDNGHVYAYVLNEDETVMQIADIDAKLGGAMALDYDTYEKKLWVAADDGYGNRMAQITLNGTAEPKIVHVLPASGVNTKANNEGFAIASAEYTVNGQRPVYKFCDGVTSGALTIGSIDCDYKAPSRPSHSSSSDNDPSYSISADKAEHGSVTVSPRYAESDDTVTITVKPDSGYILETIIVKDSKGNELKLTDKGDGKYTFTMPAGRVEVKATFMDDNTMLNFFVDVPADSYYYDAVLWAAQKGITGGTDAEHFSPNASCARGQLVTFLWRAAGKPVVNYAMSFSDVSADAYYTEAVRWAASLGIVSGYGDGKFGVNDPITREQMAVMLYRFAKAQGMDTTQGGMAVRESDDFEQVSDYAGEAMTWAVNTGILKGANNQLMPKTPCTRAQIVTMLQRLLAD